MIFYKYVILTIGKLFGSAIHDLNDKGDIFYISFDFINYSKSKETGNVLDAVKDIAQTAFLHSGIFGTTCKTNTTEKNKNIQNNKEKETNTNILIQKGVIRANCMDCLDRTNATQFCVGRVAFKQQLKYILAPTITVTNELGKTSTIYLLLIISQRK